MSYDNLCLWLKIVAILSNLISVTVTAPILGSIVQNGKFSAGISDAVNALNIVDLPILGKPTIPTFKDIDKIT